MVTVHTPVWAAPTLLEVLDMARANDPQLAAAQAARLAGQEALPQARAALLPQVGLSATLNRTQREIETAVREQNLHYTNTTGALSLRQVIYDRQKFFTYDQAEIRVALAELEWAKAEQDLILRVAEAYFNMLFAEDSVKLAEAKKRAIAAQKSQAEQMYKGGVGTVTDIQEAQARYDLAVAEELEALHTLRNRRQALFKLTRQHLEQLATLREPLTLSPPDPYDLDAWRHAAREHALEVLLAEKRTQIAQLDVERARSQHWPILELVSSVQRQTQTDLGYDKDQIALVGLQLSAPLWAGGRIDSLTRETRARWVQAVEEMHVAQADSEQRAVESFHGVNDSIARIHALQQAVRSSEVAMEAARIGLEVGYRTSVDVLNAQQQFFAARRDLLQQSYTFVLQRLRLKAAIGALTTEDIVALDPWFEKNP
ncbi:MAG: TolC family outer membrane protein [Halomonas sp.]|nr:TolC family outer membrane protein [Halomonas sp.]MDM7480984.1 TolC family outer membrane protein [Halomonas sp.]